MNFVLTELSKIIFRENPDKIGGQSVIPAHVFKNADYIPGKSLQSRRAIGYSSPCLIFLLHLERL